MAAGLLALFPDDPVGTRTHGLGAVHLALAFIAFLAVLVGAVLVSFSLQAHATWARTGKLMVVLSLAAIVPLLLLGRSHFGLNSLGALYEKIFLGMELIWFVLLAAPVAVRAGQEADPRSALSTNGEQRAVLS